MFDIQITDRDLIQKLLIFFFGLLFYDLGPWFVITFEIPVHRAIWLIMGAFIGYGVYLLYVGLQSDFKIYRSPNILILSNKNTIRALSGVLFLSKPKNVRYEGLQRNFAFKHVDNDFGTCFILMQKLRGVNWATLSDSRRSFHFNELTKHTNDFHDAVKRSMRGVQIVPLTFEQLMIDRGFAIDVEVEVALPSSREEDTLSELTQTSSQKDEHIERPIFTPEVLDELDLEEIPDFDQSPQTSIEEEQTEEINTEFTNKRLPDPQAKKTKKKKIVTKDPDAPTLDVFLPPETFSTEEVDLQRERVKKETDISGLIREINGTETET
jgi:hypothetical protein